MVILKRLHSDGRVGFSSISSDETEMKKRKIVEEYHISEQVAAQLPLTRLGRCGWHREFRDTADMIVGRLSYTRASRCDEIDVEVTKTRR
jgi:hypothetical protein